MYKIQKKKIEIYQFILYNTVDSDYKNDYVKESRKM